MRVVPPLPAEVCAWLQAFVDEHYQPEPRQRRWPASLAPQHATVPFARTAQV